MAVALSAVAALPAAAAAGTYTVHLSGSSLCSTGAFIAHVSSEQKFYTACSASTGVVINSPSGQTNAQDREAFQILSPSSSLTITGAAIQGPSATALSGSGYEGETYWNGGGSSWDTTGASAFAASDAWGMQLLCGDKVYCKADGQAAGISMAGVDLTVTETTAPLVGEGGLWDQYGWIWNAPGDPWNLTATATDPSGVCELDATVGTQTLAALPAETPQTDAWQQCPSPAAGNVTVDTQDQPNGPLSLAVTATNATGVPVSTTAPHAPEVDNVTPTVALTQLNNVTQDGDGDDPTTQVVVTPTAGPSGISSLACSDGSGPDDQLAFVSDPNQPGSDLVNVPDETATSLQCTVQNDAVNPQGQHNSATASLPIAALPTSTLSFHRVAERCRTERSHGIRRIVCRRGVASTDSLTLAEGHSTTIYGSLSESGSPVSGRAIRIFATTADSTGVPVQVTEATSGSDGRWSARIPAGPSRTITAEYLGSSGSYLPSSATATITVPARANFHVSTQGTTMIVRGKLLGGHVPTAGVPMRLLIQVAGRRNVRSVPFSTTALGTFLVRWTARHNEGETTAQVVVAVRPGDDAYPFAPDKSRPVSVTLGR